MDQSGTFIPWERVREVRQRYSWVSGRVLEVLSAEGGVITLTAHLSDPDGVREVVERFAGPDHPLARALAAVASETSD